MAKVKFDLKKGYIIKTIYGPGETEYNIEKVEYFQIPRKPSFLTLFKKLATYYRTPGKKNWNFATALTIYTSKKQVNRAIDRMKEEEKKENIKDEIASAKNSLEKIEKSL